MVSLVYIYNKYICILYARLRKITITCVGVCVHVVCFVCYYINIHKYNASHDRRRWAKMLRLIFAFIFVIVFYSHFIPRSLVVVDKNE